MEVVLFYILALVLITFSILTITARNPVRSAVYLVSALLSMAGLFFLVGAEFVGAVQILVYVGGIMVLFVFVIMLVSVREAEVQRRAGRYWKAGVIAAVVLSGEFLFFILRGAESFGEALAEAAEGTQGVAQNTQFLGGVLYGNFVLPFEIASILLLVAIIGAVVLAKKEI